MLPPIDIRVSVLHPESVNNRVKLVALRSHHCIVVSSAKPVKLSGEFNNTNVVCSPCRYLKVLPSGLRYFKNYPNTEAVISAKTFSDVSAAAIDGVFFWPFPD